ncbi:uncharacterized protein DUF2849 [Rhodobacter sp. JA431]|uniref:DUF2849 domain-containing protein n=1 Tax=Rhodobacter sp. JA431 TaxID=570013 RepID=UPI000BCA8E57|nr:DUF2849 domain-containing protein [Rhodobacter sp. JA431]SOC04779.1 uncharacterized protein DUF2849 [Rhodobacter sp. JA431]
MSRTHAKVVSANDLRAGHTVYLTSNGGWSRYITQAELITDEAEAQLRLLDAIGHATVVVGAYLVDVEPGANGPVPVALRERFRAQGPSIHPSKQTARAEARHVSA